MLKAIGKLISVTIVLMGMWIMFSCFDIIADNNTDNPQHSPYNFFVMGCERIEK